MNATSLLKTGLVPDTLIRFFIRRRLRQKLDQENRYPDLLRRKRELFEELSQSPIALHTREANEQHYELPPEFFETVLGAHLKYSCGFWGAGDDLEASEKSMLDLYVERAGLREGQSILDLGCGWGSFSLYAAERFSSCEFLAVSNSNPQRLFIEQRARQRGLRNLRVITCDINQLELEKRFDRVISIEMFEHMRNYRKLLARIASWLVPEGKLFVHIFCHRQFAYPFTHEGENDWMGRYFFTGGMMPSLDLFESFQDDLAIEQTWVVDGKHYEKTSNAWLARMDREWKALEPVFQRTYGGEAGTWRIYWRVFFMACAELFGYRGGREWCVGHYLFRRHAL